MMAGRKRKRRWRTFHCLGIILRMEEREARTICSRKRWKEETGGDRELERTKQKMRGGGES